MTQQESRVLKHTIPLKPSLIPLKPPQVLMDAVKFNAPLPLNLTLTRPHPLDLATPPGQSLYKKWWGGSKKFRSKSNLTYNKSAKIMNTDQCPGASVCCNPAWCKTSNKCLHEQPSQQSPAHIAEVLSLSVGNVSRRTDVAVRAMDDAIVEAINAAKNAGVPQGLIVGMLHAYAHDQTATLVNGA